MIHAPQEETQQREKREAQKQRERDRETFVLKEAERAR